MIASYYASWSFDGVGIDVLALFMFIIGRLTVVYMYILFGINTRVFFHVYMIVEIYIYYIHAYYCCMVVYIYLYIYIVCYIGARVGTYFALAYMSHDKR